MKSNNEILIDNLVLLEHCIHFQMKRYSTPLEFKQELFQTLSLIILEYDNTKLNTIVEQNHLNAFITGILRNQLYSRSSSFYRDNLRLKNNSISLNEIYNL